jgi:hypothetical protein
MIGKRSKNSIYVEHPDDLLEAVRILLIYFQLPRMTKSPRPLYGKTIKKACRILGVNNDWRVPTGDPNRWAELDMDHVKKRLRLAGIDPTDAVMNAVNPDRFNLTWEQLLKTRKFNEAEQQKAIARGKRAPPPEAILSVFVTSKKKEASAPFSPGPLPGATHSSPFKLPKFT